MQRYHFALAAALLFAPSAHASWDTFQIIEWQARDAPRLRALRDLGVTAVTVIADRDGTGTPLEQQTAAPRQVGLRWYIENIATDLYATYHRYTPGKDVNWRFVAAQEKYRADPDDISALYREPPLLDPSWRDRISHRLMETVTQQKSSNPLYYSLGDETGIADLSAYWDFDLSPSSLAGYRTWLRTQYGSLSALNREWGAAYTTWDAIQPETTREAMRRTDDNFAPWNDFKAWMDTSFADSLRFGTNAIHQADPNALSAIEGMQMPGWGGYDYAKLARTVDVMEIYDGDANLPLIRSINPRVIPMITSFAADNPALHAIWRSVLRGARGLVLWDEDNSIVGPDASIGPRGSAYTPVFAALRGEIGSRLMAAEPILDSVAILYSPASFRVNWILDHRHDGDAWMHRSAEKELDDNAWRLSLRAYCAALAGIGLHPRFITEEQLAHAPPPEAALILPHSIALSDRTVRSLAAFAARGGTTIADTPPGAFDEHGRRRAKPTVSIPITAPGDLSKVLTLPPVFRVDAPDGDVESFLFRSRGRRLLALHRRAYVDKPETITVDLHGWRARDIGTGHDHGVQQRLAVTLDPITPVFLEITR